MWIFTAILGAVVIFLFNYWVNSNYAYWKKRGIPYRKSSPLTMLFQYLFTSKGLTDIIIDDYKKFEGEKFGGYFQMFSPAIMVKDPDLIYRICVKDFSYFVDRSLPTDVSDFFTENISSLTGDKWRTSRHKMMPTFTSGKLKMMFDPMKETSDEVVEFINKKIGQDIEARSFVFKYVINVIGKVAFGLKVDALNEETEKDNEFLNISRSFFQPSFMLMVKFMITMTMPKVRKYIKFSLVDKKIEDFFFNLVKDMIQYREKSGEVRNDFLQIMLDQRKQEEAELQSSVNSSATNNPSKTTDEHVAEEPEDTELFNQLKYMQSENSVYKNTKLYTETYIVAQSFLFISGGSETTSVALSFLLYELAVNPEVQKRVQNEVKEMVSKHGFTYQAVRNMTYMDQCLNEALRLHTNSPFTTRVCTQDYQVPDTNIVLEKGSFIIIPIIGLNRDPQYFPDPEKFDPDRFEDESAIPEATLLSFGLGPRMCIAKRLAILNIKIVVATLMQHFDVVLSKKTKMPLKIQKSSVFQHVEGGLWIKFEKRKND